MFTCHVKTTLTKTKTETKSTLTNARSQLFTLIFPSKNSIVLSLIFMSTVHFEWSFVYGVRKGSSFFCRWISSCSSSICWHHFSSSHWIALAVLSKISSPEMYSHLRLFLDSQFYLIDLFINPWTSRMTIVLIIAIV